MKLKIERELTSVLNDWCKYPAIARTLSVLWLFVVAWIAFLWNLGSIGLIDETEPLFAEAARQMTVTGDWITPYFNGETRFDKPPLIYWLMATAYKLIGVSEWAVRLPSALAAIALMGLLFYTLRYFSFPSLTEQATEHSKIQNLKSKIFSARIGAAVMAFNPEMIAWGRIGVSDMLLTGCMCSALLTFFLGYAQKGNGEQKQFPIPSDFWYLAFYVLIALAVLTKGPVGIVLPVLIIGSFLLYVGKGREVLREMRVFRGLAIVVAIALPWYILVTLANGEAYINSFFGYHNFERFTHVVNRHGEPWYFYFLVVLLGFAPGSVYLPAAIARLRWWERDRWHREPRSNHLGLFALFWFACIFGFFTLAVTKLPSYVLPLMPAAAILVALLFSSEFKGQRVGAREVSDNTFSNSEPLARSSKLLSVGSWVNVVFFLLVAGAVLYTPHWLEPDPAMPNFPEALQKSGLLLRAAFIAIATAGTSVLLLLARKARWLWSVYYLGFVAFFIFALTPTYFLVDTERQLPVRQIAQTLVQVKQPNEETIMIGFEKPSLVFYSQQPVKFFRRSTNAREYLQQLAGTQPNPPEVLLLGTRNKLKGIGLQPDRYKNLDTAGAYQLLRVPKQIFRQKLIGNQQKSSDRVATGHKEKVRGKV